MTALLCFHLTAHQVFKFWGIFFPKSRVRTIGGIAMNLGILSMFVILSRLLWDKKLHPEGAVVLGFGILLIGFALVTHITLLKDSPHYLQVDGARVGDDTGKGLTYPESKEHSDRIDKGEPAMSRRQKIRILAIPTAMGFCLLSFRWTQVNVVATILLLYITLEYVLANQENLELFRRQLERQERVFLHFGLVCKNGPLYLQVSNLGISNFLLTGIRVRTQDLAEFNYRVHQVIESGKTGEISLPRDACADHPLSVDLEITLEFVGLDARGKTEPKCFNVSMALDNIPNETTEGLNGLWGVRCPRCHLGGMLFMSMKNDLRTFAEALARKDLLLADLGNTCPDHRSEWLMGMDDVNGRRNP